MSDVVFLKVRGTSWLGPSFGKVLFWINSGLQVGVEEKKKEKKNGIRGEWVGMGLIVASIS